MSGIRNRDYDRIEIESQGLLERGTGRGDAISRGHRRPNGGRWIRDRDEVEALLLLPEGVGVGSLANEAGSEEGDPEASRRHFTNVVDGADDIAWVSLVRRTHCRRRHMGAATACRTGGSVNDSIACLRPGPARGSPVGQAGAATSST